MIEKTLQARPANGTDIVAAALAWRLAELEYGAADQALMSTDHYTQCTSAGFDTCATYDRFTAAQDALNAARTALIALVDTRLSVY